MTATDKVGPIVVGIDGSPPSLDALHWAAGQALLQKSDLHVLVAWKMPNMLGWAVPLPDDFNPEQPAATVIKDAQDTLSSEYPGLVVETHVEEGLASRSLIVTAEAVGASLLVVGARGHGEVTGMLIGSVGEYAATHAKCPVVIVRH